MPDQRTNLRCGSRIGQRPWAILSLILLLLASKHASAYSVLTHEQVVDLLWKDQIQPLLLKKYPNSTEDDLHKAHAFAYGGSVMQDMGYYPFGSKYFSDLVHYVRTGDFVEALIRDSNNLNDYAFALGALAHYSSDNQGHPTINRVVAIEFPKLQAKFGDQVTYADNPKAHIRSEFGFDMVQVAKNRYTSDRYHDFIGFEVSKPLLEQAFQETYDLKLDDVFGSVDLAIGSFRRSVSNFIPAMTRGALVSRHDDIVKDTPNFNKRKFLYYLSRNDYEKEWGKGYRKPGIGARIIAFLLKIIPKVGPFSAVKFKIPTRRTEDMYVKSVDSTVENYSSLLEKLKHGGVDLPDTDCDTGRNSTAGEYRLSDSTYARLVDDLSKKPDSVPAPLRMNVLNYFSNLNAPIATKKDRKAWRKLLAELAELQKQPPAGPGGTPAVTQ
jgi:hypothetical protein